MLSFLVLPLRRMFLLLFYFCVHVCSVAFDSLRPYVAHQSPLSMGFSRQEYWSGLPCPPPGNLPDPGIKPLSPASPALQADSLTLSHWGFFYFFFLLFLLLSIVSIGCWFQREILNHIIVVARLPSCVQLFTTPCGSAGEESACDAGYLGLIPGLGRPPGEGKVYPLQCSGLEKPMDCIVHGVTKSRTWLGRAAKPSHNCLNVCHLKFVVCKSILLQA